MRRTALIAVAALTLVAGCNSKPVDTIDDAALEAIGEQVARNLNEPGAAIVQLVKSLDKPTPIAFESMVITLDQKTVPIDWWLLSHGLIQLIEPQPTPDRPTFLIAPPAAKLTGASTEWFEAGVASASEVDCKSPQALEVQGCLVEVDVSPTLTAAGAAVAGTPALKTIKVHALVSNVAGTWQVNQMTSDDGGLHDYALNAILGPEPARTAARQAVFEQVNGRAQTALGGPSVDPFTGAPPAAALPLVDTAPVSPAAGDPLFAPPPKRLPTAPPSVP